MNPILRFSEKNAKIEERCQLHEVSDRRDRAPCQPFNDATLFETDCIDSREPRRVAGLFFSLTKRYYSFVINERHLIIETHRLPGDFGRAPPPRYGRLAPRTMNNGNYFVSSRHASPVRGSVWFCFSRTASRETCAPDRGQRMALTVLTFQLRHRTWEESRLLA